MHKKVYFPDIIIWLFDTFKWVERQLINMPKAAPHRTLAQPRPMLPRHN
jgi:hypothetical protein